MSAVGVGRGGVDVSVDLLRGERMVEIAFSDVERAIRDRDPQLGDLLIRYLAQDDPTPGKAELPTAADLERDDWE